MIYTYMLSEYKKSDIDDILGAVGAKLSTIYNLGYPVSNGFIITTDACMQYYNDGDKISLEIQEQINEHLNKLEQKTGKSFGNVDKPLLLSVKCGSKYQFIDINDTLLNVGITQDIVENLSKNTDDYIWIWECYLIFIQNYSKLVMGVSLERFKDIENILKDNKSQLTIENLRMLVSKLKEEYKIRFQQDFPDDSIEQLNSTINAGFNSWKNNKQNTFYKDLDIPFSGTAICIQEMVFGNINKNCGTGTVFTRDPITGEDILTGNFSKQSLETCIDLYADSSLEYSALFSDFPEMYSQLKDICKSLERYYSDMLKIDFVVENNKLYIVQVFKGKRTMAAALKIIGDIPNEVKINKYIEGSFAEAKLRRALCSNTNCNTFSQNNKKRK